MEMKKWGKEIQVDSIMIAVAAAATDSLFYLLLPGTSLHGARRNPVAQVAVVVAPLGNINACPLPPSELGEDRAANRRAVMPPSTTYLASGR